MDQLLSSTQPSLTFVPKTRIATPPWTLAVVLLAAAFGGLAGTISIMNTMAPSVAALHENKTKPARAGFVLFGGDSGSRTPRSERCRPLPYHLAMSPKLGNQCDEPTTGRHGCIDCSMA